MKTRSPPPHMRSTSRKSLSLKNSLGNQQTKFDAAAQEFKVLVKDACMSVLLIFRRKYTPQRSVLPLVSHGDYMDGTDRRTDGRQTVTLYFLLDAVRIIMQRIIRHRLAVNVLNSCSLSCTMILIREVMCIIGRQRKSDNGLEVVSNAKPSS